MEKILVTYDSGYGATEAAAQVIADTLAEKGFKVSFRPVNMEELSGYDAIFIGSPIRLGRCTQKLKDISKRTSVRLQRCRSPFSLPA